MSVSEWLVKLREQTGLTRPQIGKMLGFRSESYIWMLENNQREASLNTCRKIIMFARDYANTELTLDMLTKPPERDA
jgi:transcriptional regulator with XRE-family HTH domain